MRSHHRAFVGACALIAALGCQADSPVTPAALVRSAEASVVLDSTPSGGGMIYLYEGEIYPTSLIPVELQNARTRISMPCTPEECTAIFEVGHDGRFHQSSAELSYNIAPTGGGSAIVAGTQVFKQLNPLGPVLEPRRVHWSFPVTGLPPCGITASANTLHSAWWGALISFRFKVASIENVGTFGTRSVITRATPVSAPACAPADEDVCDDPYTDEVETGCEGDSGGTRTTSGSSGMITRDAEPNTAFSGSRWVCDVTFWYESFDGGLTWRYTNEYTINACFLEPY